MTIFIKHPGARIVYELDFLSDLGADVTVVTSVVITPRGALPGTALTAPATAISGSLVRVSLVDGAPGELYRVTVWAETAGGTAKADKSFEVLAEDVSWTVPDGTTPYLTIAGFVERVGIDEAVQLTDEAGTGRIGKQRLITVLLDAQAEADGYLAARYAVPLATVPQLVAQSVAAIARAALYRLELPGAVKTAADAARRTLERIGSGAMTLPNASLLTPAEETSTGVLLAPGVRAYPAGSLDSF